MFSAVDTPLVVLLCCGSLSYNNSKPFEQLIGMFLGNNYIIFLGFSYEQSLSQDQQK